MCVLQVWARVALKGRHPIPIGVIVVDSKHTRGLGIGMCGERKHRVPFGGYVLDFDPRKANLQTRLLRILICRVLFLGLLHLLVYHTCRRTNDLL